MSHHEDLARALTHLQLLARARLSARGTGPLPAGAAPEAPRAKRSVRAPELLRSDVRELLLPMGFLLLEGDAASVEALLPGLLETLQPLREDFERVLQSELEVSCEEHVRGCDARYLARPDFDFGYVIEARERLEARLVAASALGLEGSEAQLDAVAEADARLEPYLRAREGGEGQG